VVYSIEYIQAAVAPIAKKYGLKAVYLFGSYARGTATDSSDIDLIIDTTGTQIKSLLDLASVYCDFEEALSKPIDLITLSSLNHPVQMPSELSFRANVEQERVNIYAAA
jgi:hypothetical protein